MTKKTRELRQLRDEMNRLLNAVGAPTYWSFVDGKGKIMSVDFPKNFPWTRALEDIGKLATKVDAIMRFLEVEVVKYSPPTPPRFLFEVRKIEKEEKEKE